MILLIILLFFIALSIIGALSLYNYINDDNLSIDNVEERVDKLSDIINDTEIPLADIHKIVKMVKNIINYSLKSFILLHYHDFL